jgi:hypothetical protein
MDANSHIDMLDHPSGSAYRGLVAEVGAMFDDVLEKATIVAKTDLDRANARLLVLTNELDRRLVTETTYALSTTSWLQAMCQMTGREASGTVKTARALAHMPQVADKAVTGEIVASGVKLLAMTRDRHPDNFSDHEAAFVDIATHGTPKDLRVEVSEWEQDIDYNEALANAEYDAWGRELYFNQTYRGRWDMHAEFGVADGHVIVLPQLVVGGDVEERDRGGNRFVPLRSNLCLETCNVSGSSWSPPPTSLRSATSPTA